MIASQVGEWSTISIGRWSIPGELQLTRPSLGEPNSQDKQWRNDKEILQTLEKYQCSSYHTYIHSRIFREQTCEEEHRETFHRATPLSWPMPGPEALRPSI